MGSFLDIVEFNNKHFGACSFTGNNPGWEMHPDTDEFFYIIEGEVKITLLEKSGEHTYVAPSGTVFVVPKGIWHKPFAPKGAKFIYYTPDISLDSDTDDPREYTLNE